MKADTRLGRQPLTTHGDLPRQATSPSATELPEVPNAAEAIIRGDMAAIRAWLAHPYVGNGGMMNAVAIYLLERAEIAEFKLNKERNG